MRSWKKNPPPSYKHWDFLRSWCSPLRGKLSLCFPYASRIPTCTILVALTKENRGLDPKALPKIRSALVLLTLLARVDYGGWKHVFRSYCFAKNWQEQTWMEQNQGFREPMFKFQIAAADIPDDNEGLVSVFTPLFFGSGNSAAKSFAVAAAMILEHGSIPLPPSGRLNVRTAVHVVADCGPGPEKLEHVWSELEILHSSNEKQRVPVNFATRVKAHTPPAVLGIDCAFVLQSIDVDVVGTSPTSKAAFMAGDMMARSNGIRLSRLSLTPVIAEDYSIDAVEDIRKMGHVFERVLLASKYRKLAEVAQLDEVRLDCQVASPVRLARLLSAVAESRTAKRLHLDLEPRLTSSLRKWTWERLAYTLFSPQARTRSSIAEVTLTKCDLRLQDAEAVAAVLGSDDTARDLFGRGGGVDATGRERFFRGPWMLKQGAAVKLLPMHPLDSLKPDSVGWTLDSDLFGVTEVGGSTRSLPTAATVLLPGYGLCEVERDDLVAVDVSDAPDRQQGGVTSLDLSFISERNAVSGLLRLLEVVGPYLTSLKITLGSEEDIDIQMLLGACPNLKKLGISGLCIDAARFLEAYEGFGCEIAEIDCHFSDLTVVSLALSDPTSRIARTLKRMISKCWPRAGLDSRPQLKSLGRMLRANDTLEYVEVAYLTHHDDTWVLRKQHGKKIPGSVFPLECRLAFISVFYSSRQRLERDPKRPKLEMTATTSVSPVLASFPTDENLLSIIFDFAAEQAQCFVYAWPLKSY